MQIKRYIEKRRPIWNELESLVKKAGLKGTGLSLREVERLGILYRQTTSHYALISQAGYDPGLAEGLKSLIVRAATVVYPSESDNLFKKVGALLLNKVPIVFQRYKSFFYLSAIIFIISFVIGLVSILREPDLAYSFMSGDMYGQGEITRLLYSEAARSELITSGRGKPVDTYSLFATYLFMNNTKVGLLSFASGIFIGVPTVLLHIYNGLSIGAFSGMFNQVGLNVDYLAWLLPHGIPEIFAILLCGMAGLMIGGALIHPGKFKRGYLLRERGKDAIVIVLGTIPFFLLAAFIEAFLRQSYATTIYRLLVALVLVVLISLYFGIRRRS